jgi:hypothetical protein
MRRRRKTISVVISILLGSPLLCCGGGFLYLKYGLTDYGDLRIKDFPCTIRTKRFRGLTLSDDDRTAYYLNNQLIRRTQGPYRPQEHSKKFWYDTANNELTVFFEANEKLPGPFTMLCKTESGESQPVHIKYKVEADRQPKAKLP